VSRRATEEGSATLLWLEPLMYASYLIMTLCCFLCYDIITLYYYYNLFIIHFFIFLARCHILVNLQCADDVLSE
jgi:hypothetical protein